jgi:ParB-like chromosome segregation protein Spo0J
MEDPKVGQYLELNGYKWKFVEDLVIDTVTLDHNPARWSEKLDEHHIFNMGLTLEAGGQLPAIIVAATASSLVALLSGRHRIEACKLAGVDVIGAYVVLDVLDRFELEMLPYSLNAQEGRQPDYEEKLAQAAHFAKRYPERDRDNLAKRFGLVRRDLDHYLRLEKATDRAEALGVGVDFRKLAEETRLSTMERLKLDAVAIAAVQCLAYLGIGGAKARPLVKAWAEASSETAALGLIQAEAAEHSALLKRLKRQGRRGRVLLPEQKWMYGARNLSRKWPERPDLKSFSETDLTEFREHVMDLRGQCNEWVDLCAEALAHHEKLRKQQGESPQP